MTIIYINFLVMKKSDFFINMKLALLASSLLSWQQVAVRAASQSCDLSCANGGYCTLKEGTPEELLKQQQSGKLIEICVCQPGFTGVACDEIVEECSSSERRCHNGAPCQKDEDDNWTCSCDAAFALSSFAGSMCKKPITEYCSGRYKPDSALSFCTNGGRCKADFIAAQVAPGDTSVNLKYQHEGCVCAPEFHGPHCEFLKLTSEPEEVIASEMAKDAMDGSVAGILLGSLVGVSFLLLGAVLYRRYKIRQLQRKNALVTLHQDINLSPVQEDDEYYFDEENDFTAPYNYNRPKLSAVTNEMRFAMN
jgi:hypothetical protein